MEKTLFFLSKIGNVSTAGGPVGQGLLGNMWRPHAVEGFLVSVDQVFAKFNT